MAIGTATSAAGLTPIRLGGIVFIDFAMPETVHFTPTQNSIIHKFIGGARQIDVMGRDDDVIKWTGLFLGTDATPQANLLQAYVVAGEPQFLTWGAFFAEVVVKQCSFDYHNPWLIDYAIECYVVHNAEVETGNGQVNAYGQQINASAVPVNLGQNLNAAGGIGNAP